VWCWRALRAKANRAVFRRSRLWTRVLKKRAKKNQGVRKGHSLIPASGTKGIIGGEKGESPSGQGGHMASSGNPRKAAIKTVPRSPEKAKEASVAGKFRNREKKIFSRPENHENRRS